VSFDVPGRTISLPGRLHFVSESQINLQVPWELEGFNSVLVKVSIGNTSSALYTLRLRQHSPAFFELDDLAGSGRRIIAAQDQDGPIITTSNPVRRGRIAVLYYNGGGPVDHRPVSGEPTPPQPLARTRVTPAVTIGGRPAQVEFSGLTPGSVGLYQLNVLVPNDVPSGLQPVVITMGNAVSKTATLPVE
jgi:uncharacterized protein (TIGR03437 family)